MSKVEELQSLGFVRAGSFSSGQFSVEPEWKPHQVVYVWTRNADTEILRVGIACGARAFANRYASYNRWLAGRFKPNDDAEQEKARLFRLRLDDTCRVWARRVDDKSVALSQEAELRRLWGPVMELDLMTAGWAKQQMTVWREARRTELKPQPPEETSLNSPSDSDRVRQYAFETFIQPARQKSEPLVIVRAGDIAAKLGLSGTLPQVCGALGATTFETQFRVRRVYLHGPINGANTYFVFDVNPAV